MLLDQGADGSNKFGAAGLKGAQDTLVIELAAQMSADAATSSRLTSSGAASSAVAHPSAAPETSGGDAAAAAGGGCASADRPSASGEAGAGSPVSHGSMDPGWAPTRHDGHITPT